MSSKRRLMAVLAHPDDESLGVGGTLAKYASEGVDVCLVTATRGDAGRFRGYRSGEDGHPGPAAVASVREGELRAAAAVLGLRDVSVLGHRDAQLDRADPREVVGQIVTDVRRFRPDVVVTFGPDGAYGHPDHIAISQFTTAAMVAAADASFLVEGAARWDHRIRCRSSTTSPGRCRRGLPISRRSGRCPRPSMASNAWRRHGRTGPSRP